MCWESGATKNTLLLGYDGKKPTYWASIVLSSNYGQSSVEVARITSLFPTSDFDGRGMEK